MKIYSYRMREEYFIIFRKRLLESGALGGWETRGTVFVIAPPAKSRDQQIELLLRNLNIPYQLWVEEDRNLYTEGAHPLDQPLREFTDEECAIIMKYKLEKSK